MLSQTFKFVVTYSGKAKAGVPTEFIAKFLNPDSEFAFFRMVCSSKAMKSFKQVRAIQTGPARPHNQLLLR